jgi:preprotein translocase subunit Sss1
VLKNAAIGLAVIGVAWFIVSIVFWLINTAGDGV